MADMNWRTRGAGATLVLAVLVNGCGGGDGVTNPPPPAPVATVNVSLASATITAGQATQATAELRDAQNNLLSGRSVTWASSNTAVATVSPAGLVTGVTPGTSAISATSEGKSGEATITVNVDPATQPQIQNLTITQGGQPANLSQVAGTLNLTFTLQVPAGFTGTLTLRVDTVEFLRKTVSAPAVAARILGGTEPLLLAVAENVDLNSASTTFSVTADQISEIPVLRNGSRNGILSLISTVPGGPSTEQRFSFTTSNPLHAHMLYRIDGQAVTGADGKSYTGGPGRAAVIFGSYGAEEIGQYEVVTTGASAIYGRDGIGAVVDVVQRITRINHSTFDIEPAPVERSGLMFILDNVKVNGAVINPQLDYLGTGNFTADAIGSGFANTPGQAAGVQLGGGKQYVQLDQPPLDLLAGMNRGLGGINSFALDNLGPHQVSLPNEPVFALLDRLKTVGGPARHPGFGFGANDNQFGPNYDFLGGVRWDRLADASGVDVTKGDFYVAPSALLTTPFSGQYKLGLSYKPAESSGSRDYAAGFRAFDLRGNYTDFTARTSTGNPWNVQAQVSLGQNIGLDVASMGYTEKRADLTISGMPVNSVWNQPNLDAGMQWDLSVGNSLVGIPDGYLSARVKYNNVFGFGAGPARDQYQVLPSTGGKPSASATVDADDIMNQVASNLALGMTTDGLYGFELKATDNAGRYIGDNLYPRLHQILLDRTRPTANLVFPGGVTPGTTASVTLNGSDNYAIRQVMYGVRFDLPNSLFFGNQAYVPAGYFDVPGALGGQVVKDFSAPVNATVPVGFRFFDPFTGIINMGSFYRTNGGVLQVRDMAWNLSDIDFEAFPNSAPIPSLPNVTKAYASMSTSNWCPGTCAAGGQNIVDLTFDVLDPRSSGTPDIYKASWFGIPISGGGIVHPLGTATTFTETPEAGGRRIRFLLPLSLRRYCGPPGTMLVFPVGWSTDGLLALKSNPFFSATVRTPNRYSNDCLLPY